jgi:phosphoserine phosphatase
MSTSSLAAGLSALALAACDPAPAATAKDHALASWNAGASRDALTSFVARVTTPGPDYVAPEARIAVFDNDGTLWTERPYYNQLAFAVDRVKELAPSHPAWRTEQPFAGILAGDAKAVAATDERGVMAVLAATHTGMTTEEFARIVERWIATARHPTLGRPYTELTYAPMHELIDYLEAHEFRVFIVSGGGVEFMRPWAERVYGIPQERVIGSRAKVTYEVRDGVPVLVRLPAVELLDDGAGKPVGIHQQIGRRPILAFGNSDGDFQMLEWTTATPGPHLGLLLHHTDAAREFAYDRDARVGRLSKALDEAPRRGWVVVDMKRDWSRVFP